MIEETPEERLARLGRTVPVTQASPFGNVITPPATYLVQEWKQQQIVSIIGKLPEDADGLGYDLTPTTSEV